LARIALVTGRALALVIIRKGCDSYDRAEMLTHRGNHAPAGEPLPQKVVRTSSRAVLPL